MYRICSTFQIFAFRFLAVLALVLPASTARADVPGMRSLMGHYDLITILDLSTSSDVEGRTFVGRDIVSSSSANFAIHLATPPSEDTLVVVRNIVAGSPLQLNAGSLRIGGTTNGRIINYNGGGSLVPDPTLSNAQVLQTLDDASMELAALPPTSVASIPSGQPGPLRFQVNPADLDPSCPVAVFDVSGSQVFGNPFVQQIELVPGNASAVVINVSGEQIAWTHGNMVSQFTDAAWRGKVLWNFHEATDLSFGSRNFMGALLAPFALVTTTANIDGATAVGQLTTSSEIHLPVFTGQLECSGPTPTPTATPTPTPTPTATPIPTPTPTPTTTATPIPSATAVPTPTPLPTGAIVQPCKHPCPSKIRFPSKGRDFFATEAKIELPASHAPGANDLVVTLSNADGVIYEAKLLPGDLVRRGRKWMWKDKTAKKGPGPGLRDGLFKVEMQLADDGLWRLKIRAYGDLSAATVPLMTIRIEAGGVVFQHTASWSKIKKGWHLWRFL